MITLKRNMKVKTKSKVKIALMLRNKAEEKIFKRYKVQRQSKNSKQTKIQTDQTLKITLKILKTHLKT